MKLDRIAGLAAVALLALGCGARSPAPRAVATESTPIASTRLMAAELTRSEDAPRVGKSHPSMMRTASAVDAEEAARFAPHRHDRKAGGGFSGYK